MRSDVAVWRTPAVPLTTPPANPAHAATSCSSRLQGHLVDTYQAAGRGALAPVVAPNNLPPTPAASVARIGAALPSAWVSGGVIRKASDNVYCGRRPSDAMMEGLRELGIKTIINLEDYHTYWGFFGWRMRGRAARYNIDMIRKPVSPLFYVSQRRIDEIMAILADKHRGPFYVHCLFGKERTNLVVAIHRRLNENFTAEVAHEHMLRDGFRAWLVPLLASQVGQLLMLAAHPRPRWRLLWNPRLPNCSRSPRTFKTSPFDRPTPSLGAPSFHPAAAG